MPNAIDSQIKERIAAFVHELNLMVRKSTLEAIHGLLTGGAPAPARRAPGRPAGARRVGRPRGRRPADLGEVTTKIVEHVQANDGQGISAIAEGTGIDLKTAKKAAMQLLASGALKKSGQKRGTVYHVGSGRPARGARKAKRAAKPKRKASKKPASGRLKKVEVVPVRRKAPVRHKPAETDVPASLAIAQ